MTKVTKSIEIQASPEKVFAFVIDVEKMNEITRGITEIEYTSEGPVGVGTTMHVIGKAGGSQGEFDMEVTEFEKNKKTSAHTIGGGKIKMVNSQTFEPTVKGTKITFTNDYELPYSVLGKVVDKLRVNKDVEKTMEKQLNGIKKALEA